MSNRAERRRRKRVSGDPHDFVVEAGDMLPVPEERTFVDPTEGVAEGEHLWTMFAVFRIAHPETATDPGVNKFLDLENLLTIMGPGCYICEQMYSPEVAASPCPGDAE